MRKTIATIGTIIIICLLSGNVFAADCTQSGVIKTGDQAQLTMTCTAVATAFTATAISEANMTLLKGYWLDEMTTYPGGTAPTDGTAILVTMDPATTDVFGSRGVCSATIPKSFVPVKDTLLPAYGGKTVTGTITVTPTGNSVATGIIRIVFTFWRN